MALETLTTTEVAAALRVSVGTLHNWKRSGRLVPVGQCNRGHNLYTPGQVNEFQAAQVHVNAQRTPIAATLNAAAVAKQLGISIAELDRLEDAGTTINAGRSVTNRRLYTTDQVDTLRIRLESGGPIMPGISPNAAKSLLSRSQAAAILNVNVRSLYKWENNKKLLPLARIGQQCFYTKTQIDDYKMRWLSDTDNIRRARPGSRKRKPEEAVPNSESTPDRANRG